MREICRLYGLTDPMFVIQNHIRLLSPLTLTKKNPDHIIYAIQ